MKQARQFAIKEIVSGMEITSQEQLRRELKKRGFAVTQATLSRDMRDLHLSRVAAAGRTAYAIPQEPEPGTLAPLVGAEVISIDASESLIVVHTRPASAGIVGEYIDLQRSPDIIGTVAGDNAVLVIPRTHAATRRVTAFIKNIFSKGNAWKT